MTERVLSQLAVSFLLGICLGRYGPGMWLVCLFFMAGLMACLHRRYRKQYGYKVILLRIGLCAMVCMAGNIQYDRQKLLVTETEAYISQDTTVEVVGRIAKKEEKKQIIYYLKDSYNLKNNDDLSGSQILIYLKADDYSIGDTIFVKGTYKSFKSARNEGNFDEKSYYYSKDVMFAMEAKKISLYKEAVWQLPERLYQLRKEIQQVYGVLLPETEAGVLSVMTLGEKGLLDTEVKKLYQQSGISHVLAISGLHISILGMSVYRILRKWGISYGWAGGTAGILVLCFGQISGMELSTTRAVVMFLVMLLGNALGMAYDSVTALSLSALLQLWENPFALWYAGFLFSYGAVLAVVVAARIFREFWKTERMRKQKENEKQRRKLRWYERILGQIAGTCFTSLCIQLVTLPLSLYFYYEFPVYSILINSLLLPFMGVLLLSGILGGLVGLVSMGLGNVLLQPAYYLLKWNEGVCSLAGKLPGAMWITGQPSVGLLFLYYGVFLVALVMLNRVGREERSARCGYLGIGKIVVALALVLFLRPRKGFQVCFLDVGQGDGIYIQAEDGSAFFLDGGSTDVSRVGEYRILSFLKYRGISSIQGWFVSHADKDHISGLLELWESGYEIENLFLAHGIVRDEAWQELLDMAAYYGTEVVYLKPQDTLYAGTLEITCLYPWEEGAERNAASLALQVECRGCTGLFTGDIGREQEQELVHAYPKLKVDFYKAAHHGSKNSNGSELLEIIKPQVTLVSCGENNSYGHPGEEAVARIQEAGSEIFYTMESGQITLEVDEKGLVVREYISQK